MLNDGSTAATRDPWTTSIRRSRTERTGAAEAAVLSRWIVVVLASLGYSRSELRVGGENIRVRKRKRSYQFHQRWGATSEIEAAAEGGDMMRVWGSGSGGKLLFAGLVRTWLTTASRPMAAIAPSGSLTRKAAVPAARFERRAKFAERCRFPTSSFVVPMRRHRGRLKQGDRRCGLWCS